MSSESIGALIEAERLPDDYAEVVEQYWRPLAEEIARRKDGKRPLLVGINGAQGSGKSTVCRFLEVLLGERGLVAVTLSLDDLYLTRAERRALAASVHPLFATRGVPGTHDVPLGMAVLDRLLAGEPADLPRFDKAADDRDSASRHVPGPVDVVLFEGWCIGAAPQPSYALGEPLNGLERDEDPDGTWRREVNRRLATDYAELFARIDLLIMLEVRDFEAVRANRRLQEEKLGAGPAVMDQAALDRFLAHYQRLTEHMFAELPARADILVEIGRDQRPLRLSTRGQTL
ncbi:kinase [Altererythrobacter soli]|uniref:Kinase n=1 Tax=Croceibacterium soli TaxID=1739690 RepID=A0A6I4UVR2_9SPHN|nr:kinase [Croceibacterium soli]MXP41537.1 kinase [Croceibacterium soli]